MALRVTKRELGGWKEKALRAQKRLQSASKKADTVIERVVHSSEVGAAAFIAGVVQGRTKGVEILGVPMDLGLAAGLHGLAFLGIGGKMATHLHGFGDGFLAAFLTTTGRGVGAVMREKAGKPAVATTKGLPQGYANALPSAGTTLTEDDMRIAAMAAAI